MIKRDFRTVGHAEVKTGVAVWLDGKGFEDTKPIGPKPRDGSSLVCGPFLVERVLYGGGHIHEHRVDIIDPATGHQRSMMCSWLLVPKEAK